MENLLQLGFERLLKALQGMFGAIGEGPNEQRSPYFPQTK